MKNLLITIFYSSFLKYRKSREIVKNSHSDRKNNVLGLYAGYERDMNISFFCSSLVPAEGFCDNLKNGPEMFSSIFELLQHVRPTKISIFC